MPQLNAFRLLTATLVATTLGLAGCGGSGGGTPAAPPTYQVSGSVTGLFAGSQATLLNNAGNALVVTSNGGFMFTTALPSGSAYAVTVGTQPAGHNCVVGSGSGTVASANITSVTVTCTANPTRTVTTTVTGLESGTSFSVQLNGTETLSATGNANFSFATAIPEGVGYAVAVTSQPTFQTCTATPASGTVGGANLVIAIDCTRNKLFALAANWSVSSNSLSVYEVNETSGALTPVASSPFASGGAAPSSVVVNHAGSHAFVTNSNDGQVAVFAINGATGALTPAGTFAAGGTFPAAIALNANSTAAYVVNEGTATKVTAFSVSPSTGAMTQIGQYDLAGTPAGALTRRTVAVNPAGTFVYVTDGGPGNVAAFSVNAGTGALTFIGVYGSGGVPSSLVVNPSGTQVLVTNEDGTLARMTIEASGSLLLSGPPINSGGTGARAVLFSGSTRAFVAHLNGTVAPFSIDAATGEPTLIAAGAVTIADRSPFAMAVNAAGTLGLVANSTSNNISVFAIAANGTLTEVAGSPVAAGTGPRGIALVRKR